MCIGFDVEKILLRSEEDWLHCCLVHQIDGTMLLFDLEHRLPFLSFNDSFRKFFGIMDILLRLDEKKNAKFVI